MRLLRMLVPTLIFVLIARAVPVAVDPVEARHGMVVAGHPQAAAAGVAVLESGGNAIDAAVATSLSLGVAEPYGSGLGGKLMLLYFEAKSGTTYAVDAMDAAGSVDIAGYLKNSASDRGYGYASVAVPGLAAGLWAAHQKWGIRKWADDVEPAIALAEGGVRILPKGHDLFEEQEAKLRRGDPEIARLYLPYGQLPRIGSLLRNPDLARTLELLARHGRDGFYRGPVGEAMVAATTSGGGFLTLQDLSNYEARITEPIVMQFRDSTIVSAPPPTSGAALFLPIMKVLEKEDFGTEPLRSASNLHTIGRVWRLVLPHIARVIGDMPESRFLLEKLIGPDSIATMRAQAFGSEAPRKVAVEEIGELPLRLEDGLAATTHFIVADDWGNIVCATQSLSLHFGAGVVPPGTGVVMNNSLSNFSLSDPESINCLAPGKRARSTIAPTIVLHEGKPDFAIGVPGGSRIPTALLQVLLDRLALRRSLAESIGDVRIHFAAPSNQGGGATIEAEQGFARAEVNALQKKGWKVYLPEAPGRGRHFGGINAIEFNVDGSMTGYADPRRSNSAMGY